MALQAIRGRRVALVGNKKAGQMALVDSIQLWHFWQRQWLPVTLNVNHENPARPAGKPACVSLPLPTPLALSCRGDWCVPEHCQPGITAESHDQVGSRGNIPEHLMTGQWLATPIKTTKAIPTLHFSAASLQTQARWLLWNTPVLVQNSLIKISNKHFHVKGLNTHLTSCGCRPKICIHQYRRVAFMPSALSVYTHERQMPSHFQREFIFQKQCTRLNCITTAHIKQKAITFQQFVRLVEFIDVIESRAQYWQACQYIDSLVFPGM